MNPKDQLLRKLPSISDLLAAPAAQAWLQSHPRPLVTECLRQTVEELRRQILADQAGRCGAMHVTQEYLFQQAAARLEEMTAFRLRSAINATGIILHTGLGRAVLPECVADSLATDIRGYVTLAIDPQSGLRSDRDRRLEYILTELTGAEAATVVNNNAAATLLVLAAMTAGREVLVSRGQLIEIGGSFRLPDVMAQSGAKLVEVGTTNRTHLRDYQAAITGQSTAILRVHPSNYRIVGFTQQPELGELVELAHSLNLAMIDDLGAGALVDLERFGLPHEPTVRESIAAGADVVLFSADKLIGASQGGIIVGRAACIEQIRKHPLARACRIDKICLMGIERTLHLFRDVDTLAQRHPLYRMLSTPADELRGRAQDLLSAIASAATGLSAKVVASTSYLGSGSLPMHGLASWAVAMELPGVKPAELARRLRLDRQAVFGRIEQEQVLLDVRTVRPEQVALVAEAVARAAAGPTDS